MNAIVLHTSQHKEFPETFNCVVVGEPGISAIPIYKYDLENYCLLTKSENVVTNFYTAVIPQTYEEDGFSTLSFLFTSRKFPVFGVIEAIPKLYVKFALERIYNVIIATLPNENIDPNKEYVKNLILNLFNVEPEGVIVESEYKAKAFLIHSNKLYHQHYIVRKKV